MAAATLPPDFLKLIMGGVQNPEMGKMQSLATLAATMPGMFASLLAKQGMNVPGLAGNVGAAGGAAGSALGGMTGAAQGAAPGGSAQQLSSLLSGVKAPSGAPEPIMSGGVSGSQKAPEMQMGAGAGSGMDWLRSLLGGLQTGLGRSPTLGALIGGGR